jgi:hypothetical protein
MGFAPPVEVPRAKRGELAVRDYTVDDALLMAEQAAHERAPISVFGTRVRAAFQILLPLAREALERRHHDESGSGLPPVAELGGGGDGGRDRVCGSCGWCHPGHSEENANVVGKCHVDPPIIWKGVSTWRFLRPEVGDRTPACSRWKARTA